MITIRKATPADGPALMDLYHNHLTKFPIKKSENPTILSEKLARFEADPMYHLLIGEIDGDCGKRIVSSVTLVAIENLTRGGAPYAIIENVVTHAEFRGRGYAAALMQKATDIAAALGCYKIMLLTGSKRDSTFRFYENCGFNREEKTGFIRRL